MITVEEAKDKLLKDIRITSKELIGINKAAGRVLYEDIYSPISLPSFNQSAMDGYALRLHNQNKYELIGEIKAGDSHKIRIKKGQTVRIFTGAAVPSDADCIAIQEAVKEENKCIIIGDYIPKKGNNIRLAGSDIRKGEIALKKGDVLTPAAIGFLASLGIRRVKAYKTPVVSIVTTGNELRQAGMPLNTGKIYESNSFALSAALQEIGIHPKFISQLRDDRKTLHLAIQKLLSASDVLILSGGISVGKYDLVKDTLHKIGVKELFYKVAQKPGKPLFVGKKGSKLVFALPGNPAATLICYYEYVYPTIRKMQGFSEYLLPKKYVKAAEAIRKKNDRACFLKGKVTYSGVLPLEGQESYIMKSFAEANALIYLPLEKGDVKKGEEVEVHLL
jgi:molybdopterin molybdotransferase